MRASSITRSSPVTARTSAAVTTSVPPDFSTTMCRSANAATWGRWVTTTTCAWRASSARRRPTSTAALPPTPASTSSKTNVGGRMAPDPGAVARATSMASITRDSSPPEAPWPSGRAGAPAWAARSISTSWPPQGPGSAVATAEPGPWGGQDVEMLLAAHAGAPALPLGHGASGGELSRVMLAIEVALATAPGSGAIRPPTFVFDEVDAGVGGKAAVEVGRRLAELARQAQVVVVTHLPQVAAFADRHIVVEKSGGTDVVTAADVRAVTGDDRVIELARMISGQEDSATALQHAAELLERSVVGR